MAKSNTQYSCQSCGNIASKWAGQCEGCGDWNTLTEEQATESAPKGLSKGKGGKIQWEALTGETESALRQPTTIAELDRVLGGGLVAGSAILIGGDPGIGKSTLLLQMAVKLAMSGEAVAYISGEESVSQISLRAKRLGLLHDNVQLASVTSVRDIMASLNATKPPAVVIIDSIQTMYIDNIEAAPGTVSQVRACSNELIRLAKKRGFSLFLVGHVTKDGQIAGPRVLEHMVDTVLYFEGDRGYPFRILRSVKNRFGGTDEIGVFEMADSGLTEIANPSALFLSDSREGISGAAIFAGMEGTRPILVEVQALVSPSYMSSPRRAVVGWDSNRLAMILAVLETRCNIRFSDKEVYLNIAGGLKISEPAADLAVATALLSAHYNTPSPANTVMFGEIGLSGEIRRASRTDLRLKESEKLGFNAAILPKMDKPINTGLTLNTVETIADLAKIIQPE